MQWSAGAGAGFTSGTPWLKIHPNYKEVNVERDLTDPDGVSAFFKRMNAYKKSSEILREGSFRELYAGSSVYAFERKLGEKRLVAVCNLTSRTVSVPAGLTGRVVISNYSDTFHKLRPYEFRLISPAW